MTDPRFGYTAAASPRLAVLLVAVAIGQAATPARGVIIDTITGTGNTSAPADDPGWANVGVRGAGSGVYLGDRWVLSANHVGAGSIVLGGTTYAVAANTAFQLNNGGAPGRTASTDLVMFRLTTDPGLPMLPIASTTPTGTQGLTMIGAGLDRGAFKTWLVNTGTNPWVWTENGVNPNAGGYQWGSTRTMRWGTNTSAGSVWINSGPSNGDTFAFATTFNDLVGDSSEAQAATGDSGGAVFRKNGATWELSGIMLAVDGYSGQPGSTAVFGNNTFMADLSFYRPQIMAVVPEPATGALAVAGAATVALVWLRRRRLARTVGRGPHALTEPAGR